jgi:hypothetical protein
MSTPQDQLQIPAPPQNDSNTMVNQEDTALTQAMKGYTNTLGQMSDVDKQAAQADKQQMAQVENTPTPAPPSAGRGIMAPMPFLLALTAIGGKVAGLHGQVMLGALDGMAKGVLNGNEMAFNDSMKTYEMHLKKLEDFARLQDSYYQKLLDSYGRTAEGQLQAIQMVRQITGDQLRQNISSVNQYWQQQKTVASLVNMKNTEAYRKATLNIQEQKLAQDAQQMNLDKRGRDILGELRGHYPQAAGGFGFGTRNMILNIQSVENAPDFINKPPQEVATMLAHNWLNMKGTEAGATLLGRREGATLPAINALVQDGGILDQAIDVAKKLGFGNDKIKNAAILKSQEYVGNPLVAQYKQYMTSIQAEWSQVLSRGGRSTDMIRKEAESAASGNTSMEELQGFKHSMPKEANSILSGTTQAGSQLFQEAGGGNPQVKTGENQKPPTQYKSLSDLQKAEKSGEISYDDAVSMARQNGWIQ